MVAGAESDVARPGSLRLPASKRLSAIARTTQRGQAESNRLMREMGSRGRRNERHRLFSRPHGTGGLGALVAQVHHAGAEPSRLHELQLDPLVQRGEVRGSGAEDDRADEEVVLVDQAV